MKSPESTPSMATIPIVEVNPNILDVDVHSGITLKMSYNFLQRISVMKHTGVCNTCRKEVLKEFTNELQEQKELLNVSDVIVQEEVEDPEDEDNDIPLKRARKTEEPIHTIDTYASSQEYEFSQSSEASVSASVKLEALNKFLALSGVSPVKECTVSIQDSSKRTQDRYINKANKCLEIVFSTICPGGKDFLLQSVNTHYPSCPSKSDEESATLATLVDMYSNATTWTSQRQILSAIVVDKNFQSVKELIPCLTRFKFKQAKEHIGQHGIGEEIANPKSTREKYTVEQLDHFIDFITSGQIIKDQPFGEKSLKMETGEVIKIPTVIRSLAPSSIIHQYIALCNEDNIKHLRASTLYKILDDCPAVVRRSVEGLDNFIMEGCKGVADLDKIINQLQLSAEEEKHMKLDLRNAKIYLKSGLKAHVSKESLVEDHCLSYALSSSEPKFRTVCDHQHTSQCDECDSIEKILKTVKQRAEEHQWHNKESTMYMLEEAIQAITRWKSHIIRSRNQGQARRTLVKKMTEEDAIVTCDWAMKFLPRKYREGQIDWFAKRGINWHIAVTLLKEGSNFITSTHVHLFELPVSQDASITSKILIDVGRDLIEHNPRLKNIHFFSDNAGCYKSSTNILRLHYALDSTIASFNFCEAQDGKGPCDRLAAHIKGIIRRHVNQGNDVTSAVHMKQAIEKKRKSDIKVKVVSSLNIIDVQLSKFSIPAISKLYNFQYSSKGLQMWKAYSIGEGKLMTWGALGCPSQTVELRTVLDWEQAERDLLQVEDAELPIQKTTLFDCPIEDCSKQFSTQRAINKHVLLGDCSFCAGASLNVTEKAKYIYANKIMKLYPSENDKNVPTDCPTNNHTDVTQSLPMGWALKETRDRVIFSLKQREFMVDKFNIGKVTGNKVDPCIAAEEMRIFGNFKRDEFLSGQQISSFFSRYSQQDKKMSMDDYAAALKEKSNDNLKSEIEQVLLSS